MRGNGQVVTPHAAGHRSQGLAGQRRTALVMGLVLLIAVAPTLDADRERVPDRIFLSVDREGQVVLRGAVRNGEVQRRAGELAGSVEGVSGVRNELVIEFGQSDSNLVVDSLETHEVIEPRVMELTGDPLDGAGDDQPRERRERAPRVGRATCVLSNPRFAGSCIETVEVEPWKTTVEACREVLRCLEDVRCVARYCQATSTRGGWRLELVVGPEERTAGEG